MRIDGENIYLKSTQKEDLPFFVEWLSDPEVNQFTSGRTFTLEEEVEWLKKVEKHKDEVVFSVFLKPSGEIIGNCAIHFHQKRKDDYEGKIFLGLMIGKKAEWNKGYGTDVIKTLLRYLKEECKEREVYLTVFCENLAALRCYEKCGFKIIEKRKTPERPTADEYVMKVESHL